MTEETPAPAGTITYAPSPSLPEPEPAPAAPDSVAALARRQRSSVLQRLNGISARYMDDGAILTDLTDALEAAISGSRGQDETKTLHTQLHLLDALFTSVMLSATDRRSIHDDLIVLALRIQRQTQLCARTLHDIKNPRKRTERMPGKSI